MLRKIYIFAIVFLHLILIQNTEAQEISKNSIKFSLGVGISSCNFSDGLGFVYSAGYQREIYKDRLRINPNFSIGHYSTRFLTDAPDAFFNSITLETNLYFDLIRIRAFSLIVGTGLFVNNSRGLIGTGGMEDFDPGYLPSSHYVNDIHAGGILMLGFRINPLNKRFALEIVPWNIHFGPNYFMEGHVKVQMDIKF